MSTTPQFSLVLPCRNQADHIAEVLGRYIAPLESTGLSFELIVVPNACQDATANIVQDVARGDRRIRVVENADGGWGKSVLCGLQRARGELLGYTNTARTNPGHLPVMIELYQQHQPCLVKVRRHQRQAPLREIGSWLYNLEARLLFRVAAADVNGTPKLFSREVFERAQLASQGDLIDLELMAQAARLGVPIAELPVTGFKRHGGKSSTTLASAWNMYSGAWRLWTQLAPRRAA